MKPRRPTNELLALDSPCVLQFQDSQVEQQSDVQYCRACDRNVHRLSNLSEEEARWVVDQAEGRICIWYETDEEGHILFQQHEQQIIDQRIGARKLLAAAVALSLLPALDAADLWSEEAPADEWGSSSVVITRYGDRARLAAPFWLDDMLAKDITTHDIKRRMTTAISPVMTLVVLNTKTSIKAFRSYQRFKSEPVRYVSRGVKFK